MNENKILSPVRTRFAPSPTGTPESIHLGFVIRALWNYAYARKNNGQFILRIEDTDKERSRKDTEEAIYECLHRFGITWDEGPDVGGPYAPYRQSERLTKYQEAAGKLVEAGYAYYDFDAVKREKEEIKAAYDDEDKVQALKVKPQARQMEKDEALKRKKAGEPYVVRVKMPEGRVFEHYDWILKKKIKFFSKEVSDMILLKSDGYPTYHLAVVVDDVDMEISHVFRGQEWISSTPIHLFVYEGLGYKLPEIGHFSVVLDPRTKKKFSKRDVSAMFGVDRWLNDGYLPEAVLNYLMLLGWAPKDNREIFSLDDFVNAFDQDGVQKANPTFDVKKLDWFNGYYIRNLSDKDLVKKFENINKKYKNSPEEIKLQIAGLLKERIVKLTEVNTLGGFFFDEPDVDSALFGTEYKEHIKLASEVIDSQEEWDLEILNQNLMSRINEAGFKVGDFFMSLRIAITGAKFTPPINDSIIILGREKTLNRLRRLLD